MSQDEECIAKDEISKMVPGRSQEIQVSAFLLNLHRGLV